MTLDLFLVFYADDASMVGCVVQAEDLERAAVLASALTGCHPDDIVIRPLSGREDKGESILEGIVR